MIRVGWFKIRKYYRGGESIWAVYISKKLSKDYHDEQELLQHIGDGTEGGQSYGWTVYCRYIGKKKPRNTDLLKLEEYMTSRWKEINGEYTANKEKRRARWLAKMKRDEEKRIKKPR